MEAVILVGGQGTRLQPLTLRTPKPMLRLAGAPFLAHQIARLRAAGVDHVVLATSYLPEVFSGYFGDGDQVGLRIDYVTEPVPLGTGGGIRNVADRLESGPDDSVLVVNGDIVSAHDIEAQIDLHRRNNAAVTLHLVEVDDPRAFGCVPTNSHGRVTDFVEKSGDPVTNRINAGCYVFTRHVIDDIPDGRPVSVERETFPGLLSANAVVMGYVDTSYWLDVGTPAAFVQASADVVRGVMPSPVLPGPIGDTLVDAAASIAETADITGGSAIGAAVVDDGARVDGCVIGNGTHIESDAQLTRCLIGSGARIGARCSLTDVVVGDGATVGADNDLAAGTRVWNDAVVHEASIRFSPLP